MVPVPAGAGIKDAILIVELAALLGGGAPGTAAATAIALVSRGVTILGDLIGAGVAALLGTRHGHRRTDRIRASSRASARAGPPYRGCR